MDCRQAQSSLADLSAERLSPHSATQIHSHLAQCPQCDAEWQMLKQTLFILSVNTQPLPSQQQSGDMWAGCLEKWTAQVEQQRTQMRQPLLWRWACCQPRWGWAALGGAIAVFGGVWWLAPGDEASSAAFDGGPVITQRFERPPDNTSPLVNHHSAMAFDPFTDHVGSTLVSYSATAPAGTAPAATASTP